MEPITAQPPVVLTPEAIEALPVEPLASLAGVTHRVLWRNPNSMAGVMTVEGGHNLGRHAHRENHHHMWILEGHARILGTNVGPGAYIHIPVGLEHDIDASETEGCTLYYLYLRQAD